MLARHQTISKEINDAILLARNGNKDQAIKLLNELESKLSLESSPKNTSSLKLIELAKRRLNLGNSIKKIESSNIPSSLKINESVTLLPEEKDKKSNTIKKIDIYEIFKSYDGNKYKQIEKNDFDYFLKGNLEKVSVIIPVYNRSKILGMTLAALTHQTYPNHLIEVIVVDDGSHESTLTTIRKFNGLLNISYFWQEDKGYRPGQARTAGMKLASYDNIITLDCDMLPTRNLVSEYMYILNRKKDSILVGPRRYVSTDHLLVDDLISTPYWIDTLPDVVTNNKVATGEYMGKKTVDWRHAFFKRTDFLKKSIFPFIAFASGNVAYSKLAFNLTNGYDIEFEKWGSEDTEFGYRLFSEGFYIEPVMGALAFHQEPPGGENEIDRSTGYVHTKEILKEKSPLFSRDYIPGKTYQISKYCFINSGLIHETEFKKYIESYQYSDLEIENSKYSKLIVMNNFESLSDLKFFLNKNKSSFFIIVKAISDFNIPQLIDMELKNLDRDLQDSIIEINKKLQDKAFVFWRGALARYLNFNANERGAV